jgi:hypothetical protein
LSDIANIHILEKDAGGVYLRTSEAGTFLPRILSYALKSSEGHWDNIPHLIRIIFCEMIVQIGDINGNHTLGISSKVAPDERIIVVDCSHQTVLLDNWTWSFKKFVEIRAVWE